MSKTFSCLLVAALLFNAKPAFATIYDCKTTQAYWWSFGTFQNSKHLLLTTVEFNDETNIMKLGMVGGLPEEIHMQLKQKAKGELAIATATITVKGKYVADMVLTIMSWVKPTGPKYSLYVNQPIVQITSGPCSMEQSTP